MRPGFVALLVTLAIASGPSVASGQSADVFRQRGLQWIAQRQFQKAIDDLSEAIRLDPQDLEALENRGATWLALNEVDKAIADFSEVIRLDSQRDMAYKARGAAWISKNELDKAIADFGEAIRLDPEDADAYQIRGSAWGYKKNHDKAIRLSAHLAGIFCELRFVLFRSGFKAGVEPFSRVFQEFVTESS